MSRLFCFGLGYSAGHLARALETEGWDIAGTPREGGDGGRAGGIGLGDACLHLVLRRLAGRGGVALQTGT